jgi:hypothetical protein
LDVAFAPDGKVLAVEGPSDVVSRFNADGSPDTAFGDRGSATVMLGSCPQPNVVTTSPSGTPGFSAIRMQGRCPVLFNVLVPPGGGILLGGWAVAAGGIFQAAIARLSPGPVTAAVVGLPAVA